MHRIVNLLHNGAKINNNQALIRKTNKIPQSSKGNTQPQDTVKTN